MNIFNSECRSLMNILVHSSKRAYYLNSINLYSSEMIMNDKKYFSEGEALRLITDCGNELQKLESNIKSGKYGGKSLIEYSIFDGLNENPGCVRPKGFEKQCELRQFNEFYTKELSESPVDYMIVEYLNKFNEFINNEVENHNYNQNKSSDILQMLTDISTNPYIKLFHDLSEDIIGHIEQINELGTTYLIKYAHFYSNISLIYHFICSVFIVVTFYIFVTRNFKKQLRVMDQLTNIIFIIPPNLYNLSPKIKNFIFNGKLN
ncbi:hypothetical protein LY90DRAFT_629565 [Neocallimastix californiae]|uniref:Uncharacterized protein n=1 Tax=Neocallimastix californiae TaxID=1754190 RepID=A0A1Y2ATK6_9FUNG|nr:hypothetical protein LY90DRAFT_629565 [Neocallimastix californiae]|eukprot:ORY25903.1 hypothetical protein LY90DRAFT_629565 [Neocallimastix californiae]